MKGCFGALFLWKGALVPFFCGRVLWCPFFCCEWVLGAFFCERVLGAPFFVKGCLVPLFLL